MYIPTSQTGNNLAVMQFGTGANDYIRKRNDGGTGGTTHVLHSGFGDVGRAITLGNWHHLSLCRHSSTVYFYVDGAIANDYGPGGYSASNSWAYDVTNGVQFKIGDTTDAISSYTAIHAKFYGFQYFQGYAKYPNGTTFTVPTTAFSNSSQ